MRSHLENIPCDVLEHIAFLTTPSSGSKPPVDLLHLLLTCRTFANTLSVHASPHLYSKIFQSIFDIDVTRRFQDGLTDSSLAAELVQRYRLFRRIRHGDMSPSCLLQDMWTALWMIYESGGRNEAHLHAIGLPQFALDALRKGMDTKANDPHDSGGCNGLLLWLLTLTISRQQMMGKSEGEKEELLALLRPLTQSMPKISASVSPELETVALGNEEEALHVRPNNAVGRLPCINSRDSAIFHYSRRKHPLCPDVSSAAIIMTFALKELHPLQIPPHLPLNRAIALATQRTGPTIEDLHAVASYQTPLFYDTCSETNIPGPNTLVPQRRRWHDPEFHQKLSAPADLGASAYCQLLSTLRGIWEGTLLVSPFVQQDAGQASSVMSTTPDFVCRKPIQCVIDVHLCFSPHNPLPYDVMGEDLSEWRVLPRQVLHSQDGLEVSRRKLRYERFSSDVSCSRDAWRDPTQALDCILTGRTLSEHDEAWGGYRFVGRVYRDGSIILKRESMNAWDDDTGASIFEGRMRYGSAFVGRWRSADSALKGIFSMGERVQDRTS